MNRTSNVPSAWFVNHFSEEKRQCLFFFLCFSQKLLIKFSARGLTSVFLATFSSPGCGLILWVRGPFNKWSCRMRALCDQPNACGIIRYSWSRRGSGVSKVLRLISSHRGPGTGAREGGRSWMGVGTRRPRRRAICPLSLSKDQSNLISVSLVCMWFNTGAVPGTAR